MLPGCDCLLRGILWVYGVVTIRHLLFPLVIVVVFIIFFLLFYYFFITITINCCLGFVFTLWLKFAWFNLGRFLLPLASCFFLLEVRSALAES